MGTLYISNAFSFNMLPQCEGTLIFCESSPKEVSLLIEKLTLQDEMDFVSAVGHVDIAAIISTEMDMDIQMARQNVTLSEDDILIIAQYSGPRLPEGTTTLPEGANIRWIVIAIGDKRYNLNWLKSL
jgi:hypothetical protein